MDPDLTLEKVKWLIRQQEGVRGQQVVINKSHTEIPVQAFSSQKPAK